MPLTKKQNRRRYYLHHKARKQGLRLMPRARTFYVSYPETVKQCKQAKALIDEFGYTTQLTLEYPISLLP